ncbi:MAG TPA: type II secretion system inner membrane protein GspF [Nitrospiria bacterium]|nr:type II secretion system inner membrane protein GspF [Nitrospiria bacterium]
MAVFEYKGVTADGRSTSGIIDADSPKSARSKLRQTGIFPTEVVEGEGTDQARPSRRGFGEWVTLQDIAIMTRQLATLLSAGIPLMEALGALTEQVEKGELKRVVAQVREAVREGSSLSVAVGRFPKVFPELYVQMVRAGEASGTLDRILVRLADFLEYRVRLRGKVVSAMLYPILMLGVSTLVLFLLITYAVPKVTAIFEEMHQALPLPTRILMGISSFLLSYWWLILFGVIGLGVALRRYIATPSGRVAYDRFLLRMPLFGKIVRMVALTRFSRTLSTLLSSGIPLLNALEIVRDVVGNQILSEAIRKARENIREGESIADPLRRSGVFPPLVTHMIAVGERSGELEGMLQKVADTYDNEVETVVSTLTALLSPIMILVMGGLIFCIVLAVLLPIFDISQAVH